MRTADFDFPLPQELIAQNPTLQREGSRLLVVNRASRTFDHQQFTDFPSYLRSGDLLVLNDSRVIPARLRALNPVTGGSFEILLIEENEPNDWWALMRPGKRARLNTELVLTDSRNEQTSGRATVLEINAEGHRRLKFSGCDVLDFAEKAGEVPLPPYIRRNGRITSDEDRARYQTVYAAEKGSVAAPTAGLHFSDAILEQLKKMGVNVARVTLHVGLGTFAPVKAERVEDHAMHFERYSVSADAAQSINAAKAEQRRVIAIGTTSVRVLETVAREHGSVVPGKGRTNIFLYPPCTFQVVDALLTNFHLPQSTLLMLVSAFASPGKMEGREMMLSAYAEAVRERYRFFSYGDAMFIA